MRIIKKLTVAVGILFFIPVLFLVEGLLIGLFWPQVPRSVFWEYYWFMFPCLFPGGIFAASCYLILFWKEK